MDQQQSMPNLDLPPINGVGSNSQAQPIPAQMPMQASSPPAMPPLAMAPAPTADMSGQAIKAPAMADDVDLIEKEWVSRVKEIIHNTKNDPYERSRQLTLLKSEYLQKRYNKTIRAKLRSFLCRIKVLNICNIVK